MYGPPAYVWALTVAGPAAVAAATCLALYSGAVRAGLGPKCAALLGGAAAVLLGGWLAATAVIAGHGWYRTLPFARWRQHEAASHARSRQGAPGVTWSSPKPVRAPSVRATTRSVVPKALNHKVPRRPVPRASRSATSGAAIPVAISPRPAGTANSAGR
jgi:hypothetical protein